MLRNSECDKRDFIAKEIEKRIVGPGFAQDVFQCLPNAEDEILSERPQKVYTSGILFNKVGGGAIDDDDDDNDDDLLFADSSNEDSVDQEEHEDSDLEAAAAEDEEVLSSAVLDDISSETSQFKPSHIGLITCLDNNAHSITITVRYGRYRRINDEEWINIVKVPLDDRCAPETLKMTFDRYDKDERIRPILKLFNVDSIYQLFFVDNENNTISPCFPLKYNDNGKIKYIHSSEFPTYSDLPGSRVVKKYVLDKLLAYRFFQRNQKEQKTEIAIDLNNQNQYICLPDDVKLYWRFFQTQNKIYVRVSVENNTPKPVRNNPIIPLMFQTEIKIETDALVPYSEPQHSDIDEEYSLTEKLYSDELMYGKGGHCAVEWEDTEKPTWIKTVYSPRVVVRSFSTKTDDLAIEKEGISIIKSACCVYDLSIWGKSKDEIVNRLKGFADRYLAWTKVQKQLAGSDNDLLNVISNQEDFYRRLVDNIDYLSKSERAFKCFQIANTAMYIQMLLGRDPNFKTKGRNLEEYQETQFDYAKCWDYFSEKRSEINPEYYPFQLAFLVMNIKSIFEPRDSYRNDSVDLIWFPTGGGKTEAYLALTALAIAERRTSEHKDTSGVSVIMRYTLRLLTSQQFERASFLICALDYLRDRFEKMKDNSMYSLGKDRITIGMWIGKSVSPNKITDLSSEDKYREFFNDPSKNPNPFPVVYCPWCGCNLVSQGASGYGEKKGNKRYDDYCLNEKCHFNSTNCLPIYYVDDQLYDNPPTLLFATVDKFALLNSRKTGVLFGFNSERRKPDLIIQDELHLISGPLGSLVGLYEAFVEELATEKDEQGNILRKPKIIASTATTRNTAFLVRQLYNRNVVTFPASGIKYSDNFFSHIMSKENSKRLYMGLSPTGHTAAELEIRTVAAELVAKERLITEWSKEPGVSDIQDVFKDIFDGNRLKSDLDLYWPLVLYYTNLKSLGRTHSRLSQEIEANVVSMRKYSKTYSCFDFLLKNFSQRSTEFTSRQNSAEIKKLLVEAAERVEFDTSSDNIQILSKMDVIQATNMISVGIDIERWNIMMMVGMPITTAEYIQSSSRAGRQHQGLIVSLYNPLKIRELSSYENFSSYHQVFYKFVEPLSVTTFTENTIDMLLLNLFVGYMVLMKQRYSVNEVRDEDKKEFKDWLLSRSGSIPLTLQEYITDRISFLSRSLIGMDSLNYHYSFDDIINNKAPLADNKLNPLMKSLRLIDKIAYLSYE